LWCVTKIKNFELSWVPGIKGGKAFVSTLENTVDSEC